MAGSRPAERAVGSRRALGQGHPARVALRVQRALHPHARPRRREAGRQRGHREAHRLRLLEGRERQVGDLHAHPLRARRAPRGRAGPRGRCRAAPLPKALARCGARSRPKVAALPSRFSGKRDEGGDGRRAEGAMCRCSSWTVRLRPGSSCASGSSPGPGRPLASSSRRAGRGTARTSGRGGRSCGCAGRGAPGRGRRPAPSAGRSARRCPGPAVERTYAGRRGKWRKTSLRPVSSSARPRWSRRGAGASDDE